jgi:hypothetical protein
MEKVTRAVVALDINKGWKLEVKNYDCRINPDATDILVVTQDTWSKDVEEVEYIKDNLLNKLYCVYNSDDPEHMAYEFWCLPEEKDKYLAQVKAEIKSILDDRYDKAKRMLGAFHTSDKYKDNVH